MSRRSSPRPRSCGGSRRATGSSRARRKGPGRWSGAIRSRAGSTAWASFPSGSSEMALTLHSYWRATAPYRVRIGLNLKGLAYDYAGVNLVSGDQHAEAYKALNRQELTPALVTDDGHVLTQSLAILEWLEE